MNNPSNGFRVFLGNVINHFSSGLRREIGTLGAKQSPVRATFFVKRKIESCSLGSTIFTPMFLVATEAKHVSNKSLTNYSEINVKIVAT